MITETHYHTLANALMDRIENALEEADANGDIELEREASVLTIALESGKHYLISKHAPSKQMWVSSPLSGGLHFSYAEDNSWKLADGRELLALAASELATLAGIKVTL